jgi:RNase adaptor protein for sRNA GlmZ degradation
MTRKSLFVNIETLAFGTKTEPRTVPQLRPVHLTIDAIHLPNPHKAFPTLTGCDPDVRHWLAQHSATKRLLTKTVDDIGNYLLEEVERPAAVQDVNVAIRCLAGRHRSVALAYLISEQLLQEAQLWQHTVIVKLYLTSLKEIPRA